MRVLLVSFLLPYITAAAEVFHPATKNWVDYRLKSRAGVPPTESSCVRAFLICGGCKDIYKCDDSSGTWDVSWVLECEGSQTCNNGQCVDTPNKQCSLEGMEFECVSYEGMYPDPGSCKTFYYCVPDGDGIKKIESSCGADSDYGYNPGTTYCDVPLVDKKCGKHSVPFCENPGQTGALEENPTMYYICEPYESSINELYPFLYTCPNGKSYDGNFMCIYNSTSLPLK